MIPPPNLIARLQSDGVSTSYLVDSTGESRANVVKLLTSLGAKQNNGKWILPSVERTRTRDIRMANGHSGGFVDNDMGTRGRRK